MSETTTAPAIETAEPDVTSSAPIDTVSPAAEQADTEQSAAASEAEAAHDGAEVVKDEKPKAAVLVYFLYADAEDRNLCDLVGEVATPGAAKKLIADNAFVAEVMGKARVESARFIIVPARSVFEVAPVASFSVKQL